MKKITAIIIIGRKWFDKVNGNTYHSASVNVLFTDGSDKDFTVPFQYGYGDQYQYSAWKALKKANFVSGSIPYQYCKDNKIKLITNVSDVSRKKDL